MRAREVRIPAARRRLLALGATTAALGLAVTGAAATPVQGPPATFASALSPADIAQLSANATDRVIVLLKNQHPEIPGPAGAFAQRLSALSGDQGPIVSELSTLRAPAIHRFSFVNAISATVSSAEAQRLAADPTVAAVVPDAVVSGPSPAPPATPAGTAKGAAPAVTPPVAPGVCPTDPSKPLLEPEALQLMSVDFGPGSTQPAAHALATGKGVKIAVFPDGLDPNIPDFIRPGGTSAIFDYQDFTGEGLGAQTGGEEAFGDASSLISQGNQVFDLSKEVNPAHPLPAGCNIRIEGVAPDASVAVMKVFGDTNSSFNSEILQGLEYAVLHDHVDILSESFGGNPVPNPGDDPTAVFNQDAVAAGITTVVSSGDAGTTSTIGTPATAPGVIGAGASTSYRLYAQTGSYGYPLGGGGWESSNVSAFSSSGFTEYGPHTIDVLAPGESGWADCSTNIAIFTECSDQYNGPHPQPIVAFGGTSQSAPLTAGTAALVIQGYRDTHGGATPSPALVKQIIMSSATDLDAPAQNQGAGLVDALRAVQLARSVAVSRGSPPPVGQALLYSPTSLSVADEPGRTSLNVVAVTNTGTTTQIVSPAVRALGAATTVADGNLTLAPATDPTVIYQSGATAHDVHTVTFPVAAGVDRLVSRIAWAGSDGGAAGSDNRVRATLFDPSGRIASQSRPQGTGGGFGEDEIHSPQPGNWKLVVFDESVPAYAGPLHYTITTAAFHNVAFGVSPASLPILPGGSGHFVVHLTTPAAPGDAAEAVTFASRPLLPRGATAPQPPLATIPVTLRALVPVGRNQPASFGGTVTGGNARAAFYGQELPFQFEVPTGVHSINVDVSVGAAGYQLIGFLADPNMSPVDVQETDAQDGSGNLQTLHLTWANPTPGLWNLDLTQIFGIQSLHTSVPITGTVSFDGTSVTATGVPGGATIRASAGPVTAKIHVVNTGNSPAAYSIDPRLNQDQVLSLSSLAETTGLALPVTDPSLVPQFVVPPFSTRLDVEAATTVPIDFTTSPDFGAPEVLSSTGNDAIATYTAPDIPASIWACPPTEIGPGPATATTYDCGADATTKAFDPSVTSSTGNIWSALENLTSDYTPLILQPGQSGDITVTIAPTGSPGQSVSGFLAVETFSFDTVSSDQVASIPYSYSLR
jgi:hypothetical protein